MCVLECSVSVEPSAAAWASSLSSSPWAATASSPSEYTGDFCSFHNILPGPCPGQSDGRCSASRQKRPRCAVFPVLWLPVPAAEHNAGLRAAGTYQRAILQDLSDFQDKVVLDAGCGSGILSFFCCPSWSKEDLSGGGQHHDPARRGQWALEPCLSWSFSYMPALTWGAPRRPDPLDLGDYGNITSLWSCILKT